MIKKILFLGLISAIFMLVPTFALAAETKPATIPCVPHLPCIQTETQEKGGVEVRKYVLEEFGANFIIGFLGISAVTAVIFIIVGGLQMHLAMGNEEAVGKAKKTLIWAIAGLIIAILAVTIVRIITNLPLGS